MFCQFRLTPLIRKPRSLLLLRKPLSQDTNTFTVVCDLMLIFRIDPEDITLKHHRYGPSLIILTQITYFSQRLNVSITPIVSYNFPENVGKSEKAFCIKIIPSPFESPCGFFGYDSFITYVSLSSSLICYFFSSTSVSLLLGRFPHLPSSSDVSESESPRSSGSFPPPGAAPHWFGILPPPGRCSAMAPDSICCASLFLLSVLRVVLLLFPSLLVAWVKCFAGRTALWDSFSILFFNVILSIKYINHRFNHGPGTIRDDVHPTVYKKLTPLERHLPCT